MSEDAFRLAIVILGIVWTVGLFWWVLTKDD